MALPLHAILSLATSLTSALWFFALPPSILSFSRWILLYLVPLSLLMSTLLPSHSQNGGDNVTNSFPTICSIQFKLYLVYVGCSPFCQDIHDKEANVLVGYIMNKYYITNSQHYYYYYIKFYNFPSSLHFPQPQHKISSDVPLQLNLVQVPKMMTPLVKEWIPRAFTVSFKVNGVNNFLFSFALACFIFILRYFKECYSTSTHL